VHVIGTAGHVDHGKSALVRALTGTDPDRWIEEKLRGMTLDLGFARLRFDDGVEAGIVDVPGHERFLHNMLAGAAGMELLLLVVAANEGPRPQTIEHLAILSYLNVRRAIVVLTKSDLVDDEGIALVTNLTNDAAKGTVAEGAPIIPVSTVSGAGLAVLRRAIYDTLQSLRVRAADAPPYLPVDRVFALPGRGTIVTGTLMQGALSTGDTLQLSPLDRPVRVRSLQVFGEDRERVDGGSRVAVNLPGVDTHEIRRGAVLASAQFEPRKSFRVQFKPYAPALLLLRRRVQVRVYVGSAEINGTMHFESVPTSSDPVTAIIHLREATIGLPGATFVVRRLSPKQLLGGGLFETGASDTASDEADDGTLSRMATALRDAGLAGGSSASIGGAANVREDLATQALLSLQETGRAYRVAKPDAFVDAGLIDELAARIAAVLENTEGSTPWMMGTTSLALARELGTAEPLLLRVLALLAEDGKVAARSGYYATPTFTPRLSDEQRDFFDRELLIDPRQPFLPVPLSGIIANIRANRIPGLSQAFDTLVASGAAVKVGDNVYRGTQVTEVRQKLEDALRSERQITAAQFRDIVGTSRKFAVPLLEWFDASGVTVRSGDYRMLREHRGGLPERDRG